LVEIVRYVVYVCDGAFFYTQKYHVCLVIVTLAQLYYNWCVFGYRVWVSRRNQLNICTVCMYIYW